MSGAAARAYLLLGMGAIVVHFVLPSDVALYDSIGMATAGAILFGTLIHRPANRRAWLTIAASQMAMACGDVIFDNVTTRYPGPADAFYLLAVALLVAGVVMLAGSAPRGAASANIDAILVTFAFGIASWALVFDGIGDTYSWIDQAVSYAYPASDLLVLGLVARLFFAGGRRTMSFWLIIGAALALFAADAVWVVPALEGSYDGGTSWPDAGWLGSYVLLGAAALHPSMRESAAPLERERSTSMTRIVVIGVAVAFAPCSVAIADALGRPVNLTAIGLAGTVLLIFVLARFILIVRDLDRLRQMAVESERKFRMVFERAPIGISVGRNGIMSETNPALHGMLGYSAKELAHKHYSEVTHPDDLALEAQREFDAGQHEAVSFDKRYVAKDGDVIDTRVRILLDLEDGLGMSLIEDVTERRRLEGDLREAQKLEAVGKLAGGVAHDFNNLMTGVLGYSDLVLAGLPADDPNRSKIEAIRESAVRASDLTAKLLAFGRKQMLQATDVDLRAIVAALEPVLLMKLGDDIALDLRLARTPIVVRSDRAQLAQVVMNLATNAVEAMCDGGTLEIGVTEEGAHALLVVEDSGCGMDETTLGRVFEPFFTTKPVGAGPGLGLSTVHGIVGQSGGTIDVESEPGSGTRVAIRLPLAPALGLPAESAVATVVD